MMKLVKLLAALAFAVFAALAPAAADDQLTLIGVSNGGAPVSMVAGSLGVHFNASGATEPGTSLKRADEDQPWSLCRRPWTLMYFTAHGRAIPCCIAPFSLRGYDSFTLGDATQETLRDIWNGDRYQGFRSALLSDSPPTACAGCGLRWSL